MYVPILTIEEINRMSIEDLDNFDLEFDKWLKKTIKKDRGERLSLKPSQYKQMLIVTLHKEALLC